MYKWMAMALGLGIAAPAMAEKYECEFGRYTYYQELPCDHPDGAVHYYRQEAKEKQAKETQERVAIEWRAVFSDDDVYRVLGMAEVYLQRHMKDPDSFDVVTRHPVMTNNRGYKVDITYRARNGFGGMSIETATVFLDNEMRGRNVVVLE